MNYAELTANIQDVCETTFTADQLAMFVQQAEEKIHLTVQLPSIRGTSTLTTVAGTETVTAPSLLLYSFSLALTEANGAFRFLLNKDVNFLREAYPNPATTGVPSHYAIGEEGSGGLTIRLGPTPDAAYDLTLKYARYPESIVTAGTTWLGDNGSSALLNGSLVEAARFMQQDPDVVQNYDKLYLQSIALLKQLSDAKLRQDVYRSGQVREVVS